MNQPTPESKLEIGPIAFPPSPPPTLFVMRPPIMRLFRALGVLLFLASWTAARLCGAEFKLVTGDIVRGDLASATTNGIVVKLAVGGFSDRIDYARLTDETLKDLLADNRSKKFVEPFIAPPAEEKALEEAKQIPVKQPTRLERPQGKPGMVAAFTSPNGLVLLGFLYIANLYAAFHVARFRWRPVALVCGVAAVLPVLGPIIFLALHKSAASELQTTPVVSTAETAAVAMAPSSGEGNRVGSLGVAKHDAKGGVEGLPKVFKRGDITFNRRFFETQFPNFFRAVVSEAERDLVIDISAGKSSCVASRISRISSNEIHFKTSGNVESTVDFAQITEVTLRHKDHR
jgi:hypothetical protein